MNGQIIRNVRLYFEYGNCLRSVPRLNLTIIRFESDDSQKKENNNKKTFETGNHKFQSKVPLHDKIRMRDLLSENIFVSMKTDKRVEKELSLKTEDEKSKGDYKIKLKGLIQSSEIHDNTSPDKAINVHKPIKNTKNFSKATTSEKERFFSVAKEVAENLKIDVSSTQNDLYTHYTEIGGTKFYFEREFKLPHPKKHHEKENIFLDETRTMEEAGCLNIFPVRPEKEEKGRYEPTTAPEESEGKIEESMGTIQEEAGEEVEEVKLEIWEALKKIDLHEKLYSVPSNYFEELILWTNLGKLHRFPIDNEQDWHEEHSTDFTEHIFLEKHLEPWCPQTGPLRHFMELITAGLSKNPYLSVKKKVEHLTWYRDYFFKKSSLLKEVGINLNVEE